MFIFTDGTRYFMEFLCLIPPMIMFIWAFGSKYNRHGLRGVLKVMFFEPSVSYLTIAVFLGAVYGFVFHNYVVPFEVVMLAFAVCLCTLSFTLLESKITHNSDEELPNKINSARNHKSNFRI